MIKKKEQSLYLVLTYQFVLLLFFYQLCRLGFLWVNYAQFKHLSTSELLYAFWGGLRFDIVAILYINLLYIVLQGLPYPLKYYRSYQKFCKGLFILTNSIGFLANFSDFAYFQFTLKRTTGSVFSQFANESNILKLLVDFILDYWYLALAFAIFVWLFAQLSQLFIIRKQKLFSWKHYLGQGLAFIFIIFLFIGGVRGDWKHSTRPITLSNAGDYVAAPGDMALVLNTPFSILKTLKSPKVVPIHYFNEQELKKLYNPIHHAKPKGPFKNLNVVFLIIESFAKEHIGALNRQQLNGKYKGYTPFVDSLVAESFTATHTYANGRKSIDALPSIITGIPSIREPFVLSAYSSNNTTSIAKLLADKGYETAFFHGAPNGSMGFSAYTNLAGIKHYYGKNEYGNDKDYDGIWGIWDEPFMQYMAHTINGFRQPFFSAFFSVSSHHPFKVPEKYKGKFPKGPLEVQEPIGYTDMAIRKFFETAKKMPWYNNTLFVLCADHATVSYLPEYQSIPGYFSIPILFYYPGGNGQLKGMSNKIIQQIDIMPTVLNFLNYDKDYFAFGFDALSPRKDNFAINNNDGVFNFFQGNYLLLHDGTKALALYNIAKTNLSQDNLLNKEQAKADEMEKLLKAFIQQYNNRMINNQLTYPENQ